MTIRGTIVHGKHIGRTLGFPTANLMPEDSIRGVYGVYAAWFYVDEKKLPCMVNIGRHPTLPEGDKTVEAHIFHFQGDLYGRHARIETVALLRGEVKFPSPQALRDQLEKDAAQALEILKAAE